jgi:putative acetyltransferase
MRVDDLSGQEIRALIARHLSGMHENSPPESVHALDVGALKNPGVTFWSAWVDGALAGCGALKRLDAARGEIKSMRVLEHIISEAQRMGLTSLWLETGSTEDFRPAIGLYNSAGFMRCGPFEDYVDDPFSVFMTRKL